MNYIDFLPYYKVLETSQSLKSKNSSKRICIYTIFDFNPLILNSYINFYLTKKKFNPIILEGKFDQISQEILSIRENKKFKDIDVLANEIRTNTLLKIFGDNLFTWKIRCSKSISKKPRHSLLTTRLRQLPIGGLLFVSQVAEQ